MSADRKKAYAIVESVKGEVPVAAPRHRFPC